MIERNQVWKFEGTLWRVERVGSGEVDLVELLGKRSMNALSLWLKNSPEWELVYEHQL